MINSSIKTLPMVAGILAVAVLVETLLFRIFARGGVYFIEEDTPRVIKDGYTLLVLLGNVLFNFAAPIALIVLGLISLRFWTRSDSPVHLTLAVATAIVTLIGAAMMSGFAATALSTAYFMSSSVVLIGAIVLVAQRADNLWATVFVTGAGISYLMVYAFKGFGSQAIANSGVRSANLFGYGEWIAVAAFIAMAPLLRGHLDRKTVTIASFVAVMAFGMSFGRADSVPLIATWAFGLSLSLPYFVYPLALWVVTAFVVTAVRRGQTTVAIGLLLVLLGHRTLPLTYFNDLILIGILLIAMDASPRMRISPSEEINFLPSSSDPVSAPLPAE